MSNLDWKTQLCYALENNSINDVVGVLESQRTAHAGTAPAKVKQVVIRQISAHYTNGQACLSAALALCHSGSNTAAQVGGMVFTSCYDANPTLVGDELLTLADHPHWEVREWAASAAGVILEKHFQHFYPTIVIWAKNESENVRRAALLAVMYAGKSRNPAFVLPILDTVESLLCDRSSYVANNLGAFALGAALIRYYPDEVIARMHKWVQSTDEQLRWNLAMVFTAAEGAKYASRANGVLAILCADNRTRVKHAVVKAMRRIDASRA